MNETASLIEKARRYLKSAKTLITDGDYESSVSRAYYAMFYAAEAALLKKGLSFSSHKGVISGFSKHFVKAGIFSKQMGRELSRAFEKRQIGDYGHAFAISSQTAEQMLETAKEFVDAVADWLKAQT